MMASLDKQLDTPNNSMEMTEIAIAPLPPRPTTRSSNYLASRSPSSSLSQATSEKAFDNENFSMDDEETIQFDKEDIAARWILVIEKHLENNTATSSSSNFVNETQFLAIMGSKHDALHRQLFKYFCNKQQQQQQQDQQQLLPVDSLFQQLCQTSVLPAMAKLKLLFALLGNSENDANYITPSHLQCVIACIAKDRGVMLSGELLDAVITTVTMDKRPRSISVVELNSGGNSSSTSEAACISVEEFYAWLKASFIYKSSSFDANIRNASSRQHCVNQALSSFLCPPQLPKLLDLHNRLSNTSTDFNNSLTTTTKKSKKWFYSRFKHHHHHTLVSQTSSSSAPTVPPLSSTRSCIFPRILQPRYVRKHPLQAIWTYFAIFLFTVFFVYGLLHALLSNNPIERGITTARCQHVYAGAKGFGFNLNLWCAVLVGLMCRRTLNLVRNTPWLRRWIPVDSAVYAHKMCAFWIVTPCIIGHVSFHLAHFACLVAEQQQQHQQKLPAAAAANITASFTFVDYMFTTKPNFGFLGLTVLLGWIPLICHLIIMAGALPRVRQSGYFELFFWTHTLFLVYLVVLIFHSDKFIWYILVPGVFYAIEKLNASRMCLLSKYGKFFVLEATLWKSGVTGLKLTKPSTFKHKPGDYLYINIPDIAKYEWHPFTISSAPENEAYLTLHVRSLGGWTRRLHEFMRNRQRRLNDNLDDTQPAAQRLALHASTIAFNVSTAMSGNPSVAAPSSSSANDLEELSTADSVSVMTSMTALSSGGNNNITTMLGGSTYAAAQQQLQINTHAISINSVNPGGAGRRTWQRHPSILGQRVAQRHTKIMRTISQQPNAAQTLLRVYVDGPYGTPTSSLMMKGCGEEHAVLICAGIGVTPSAAILESLVLRYKSYQVSGQHCQSTWIHDVMRHESANSSSLQKCLKKIDFIWVVRSQAEVEWFYDRLQQLEREQDVSESLREFITIHLYITSMRGGGGGSASRNAGEYYLPSLILDAALDATFEQQKVDVITGLGYRAKPGRPNWDEEFLYKMLA